jgi:hypothetical protein
LWNIEQFLDVEIRGTAEGSNENETKDGKDCFAISPRFGGLH